MANFVKYESYAARHAALVGGGMTAEQAREELLNNYEPFQRRDNIDSPQDSNMVNTTLKNLNEKIKFLNDKVGSKSSDLTGLGHGDTLSYNSITEKFERNVTDNIYNTVTTTTTAGLATIVATTVGTKRTNLSNNDTFLVTNTGVTNTGAVSININSYGLKNIFGDGLPLVGGEIDSGKSYFIIFDGTQFNIVGAGGSTRSTSAAGAPTATTNPAGKLGSVYVNTLDKSTYICVDDTNNANLWKKVSNPNNFVSTIAPTVSDDSVSGYQIGDTWVDSSTNLSYICTNNAVGVSKWEVIYSHSRTLSSAATLKNRDIVSVQTSGATLPINTTAFSISLPASPKEGDWVRIIDGNHNAQARPVLLLGNGKTISGDSELTMDVNYFDIILRYNNIEWSLGGK
jgi:hypothetical protein